MFNRGFRRDDRNSFRSNANMSRGHNAPSLMSVSPWEGGIVPGSGGSSILGTPQLQGAQNVLTPQAQVLAQNLNILSNLGLLQPQLQTRQTQALPSLINLGSALNRTLGYQSTGYQNRGPVNRFQDQRQKFSRRDMKRVPEPFNKNRPRTGQSQTSQQKLQSYRPLNSKLAPLSTARKPVTQGADALAKARADVRGKRVRKNSAKSNSDVEGDEDAKKEEGEEVVKKRDWKKEKKTDVIDIDDDDEESKEKSAANATGDAEMEGKSDADESKDEEKAVDGAEKEEGATEGKEKEGEKSAKSTESSIYNCHVCSKVMADEGALSSHIRTASHKRMMNRLEETYAIKVKGLRDKMRLHEQQKEMEMNVRGRGRHTNMQRGHCKMCDLTFMGNITAHRKTPLHVKLKNFLHPNCVQCGKEFPARMEWDMHKLTAEHLKAVANADKKLNKQMVSANDRNEPNYARLVPKFPEGLDSVIANMDEEMSDKAVVVIEDGDDGTINYDPTVVTGINMLVHGQHCGVCSKFFARRPDALEHCRTRTHFDNYLLMKAKLKAAAEEEEAARLEAETKAKEEAKAKAEAEAEAKAEAKAKAQVEDKSEAETKVEVAEKEAGDTESEQQTSEIDDKDNLIDNLIEDSKKTPVVCLKRTAARKDEGNWKRSRGDKNDDEEDEADEEDEEREVMDTTNLAEDGGDDEVAVKMSDDTDKYDPLEPTSPAHSIEANLLETSFELLQAVENDLDGMDATEDAAKEVQVLDAPEEDPQSPVSKPANKARRGRKRK